MPSSTARHFPFPPSFPFSNVFAAVALSLVVHGVAAQTAPDAGSLRQQFERDRALPLPRKVAPERLATPEPM